jgi:hypothetical protein
MNIEQLIDYLEDMSKNYEPYADYEDQYNQGCKDTYDFILKVIKGESIKNG